MTRVNVHVTGFEELHLALTEFGPGFAARLVGPALNAAARVVRVRARKRNFAFTDRTGRLRKSIRNRTFRARIGDGSGKYRSAGARVIIGGVPGARQGHLVERGQPGTPKARPYRGGPQNARSRLTVETAQLETIPAQEQAFAANLRRRFPAALARMRARTGRARTLGASFGRRVSLRGRRRR